MKRVYAFILILSVLLTQSALSQNVIVARQFPKYFKVEIRKDVYLETNLLLYLPDGYDSLDRQWPLLLFLHGSGERGDMLELVKKNGPPMQIEFGKKFPFIVVSPQCPDDQEWSVEVLDMLLKEMADRYRVDTDQVWATGLSMGGTGTWELAIAYPDRFAAIVPVCGSADPQFAPVIKNLPIWVFHGQEDEVVPISSEENMVDALKALGSPVKFTAYPDTGHDAWTGAYNDPEMWEWLQQQHRK